MWSISRQPSERMRRPLAVKVCPPQVKVAVTVSYTKGSAAAHSSSRHTSRRILRSPTGSSDRLAFPVTAPLHFPEVVDCLMVQYQLAVSIELAPLAIVIAGDHIHLFTPFLGGMRWVSPFPLTRRTQSRSLPAKSLLFENFSKKFFEAGMSSENSKKRPASRNGPAGRRNVL